MTTSEPLSAVSRTALSVALVRAYESARPDPLFRDPYAAAFVDASGMPMPSAGPAEGFARRLVFHGIIRTRFYDDRLIEAGCDQVVLLAAGLDTRAYRLPWQPGTRLFELDFAPVLAFKQRVLAQQGATARCERTAVAADLLHDDWPELLNRAGFDAARPTVWLAEGLLVYLTAQEASGLLSTVGSLSAAGSRLFLERGRDVTATPPDASLTHITGLWKGGLGPRTHEWLARHGWSVEVSDLATVAAAYGRPATWTTSAGFVSAVRTAS
ncbi:SAM-dependent methyltransferase [Streptomyces carpinensis]|uniref:S-adenosyl-L-methionine-dependent methyltransferase n=1 Tax=Streptomyces carpinensis TaxID=66369 RepID=A0ABV1W2I6_9ACTN|nr:SAM-dependent methyltransferase [Streptomyces carpinensis]